MQTVWRPTGYKWIKRFEELGQEGLKELSKAPSSHPNATPRYLVDHILKVRAEEPKWGARKILGWLRRNYKHISWPSDTTIHNILDREGMIIPRKVRRRVPHTIAPLTNCESCNEVWCVDFKGWFLTKDGRKCEPLTMTDNYSRYLLHCAVLPGNNTQYVWSHFDYVFREYGLPLYIRSDNGAPFGSTGLGRLCRLAIKLIKAGVIPEWIAPGKPQENGRHERMHRTLKSEVASPPAETFEAQKQRLLQFVEYYNYKRPHESLGQVPPADVYQKSSRSWNGRLTSPEYGNEFKVYKVRSCGKMSWDSGDIYLGRVLANEPVGIKKNNDGINEVYFGPVFLGYINGESELMRPKPSRKVREKVK